MRFEEGRVEHFSACEICLKKNFVWCIIMIHNSGIHDAKSIPAHNIDQAHS